MPAPDPVGIILWGRTSFHNRLEEEEEEEDGGRIREKRIMFIFNLFNDAVSSVTLRSV
jgi:hypothetical protein